MNTEMGEINWSHGFFEELKCNNLAIDIKENLEPTSECCIYKVPRRLRKVNKKAYTPQLISIGPIHYLKKELVDMEKQKVRYKRKFGERIKKEKWEELITYIKKNEQRICNCYSETFKLGNLEFVMMILYDAIFIIELFLRNYHADGSDFLLTIPQVIVSIRLDLQLLENQLPYGLIERLYELAFASSDSNQVIYPSFMLLSTIFFKDIMFRREPFQEKFKHFTDMRRHAFLMTCLEEKPRGVIHLPNAVKLHESGVKFKCIKGECLLDIRVVKRKRIIPCLQVVELQIPHIYVFDEIECLFRNLMALEQCHYPFKTHFCNYIRIMDCLIDTDKDVDLLVQKGIISHGMGDMAAIAKLFNKLGSNIQLSSFNDIGEDLREHYNNSWNHAKATLKSVYFNNPWRSTGTIAAVILLLLTLIQTICSILSIV